MRNRRKCLSVLFLALALSLGSLYAAPQNSITVFRSYYTLGIYDFFNGHDVPGARYFTTTGYGMDNGIGYSINLTDNAEMEAELALITVQKKSTILPDGISVTSLSLLGGASLHHKTRSFNLYGGILLGGIGSFNAGSAYLNGAFGFKAGMDFFLKDPDLSLGIQSRVILSYSYNQDPLYRNMTYLIDPAVFVMKWRF